LLALNPGVSPKNLQAGDALYVPQGMGCACPVGNLYQIQQGDTYQSLAAFSGATIEEILALNPALALTGLIPGRYVCLPAVEQAPVPEEPEENIPETLPAPPPEEILPTPSLDEISPAEIVEESLDEVLPTETPSSASCSMGRLYRIEKGDILYDIARHSGVSVDALLAANTGLDPMHLQIGSYICIPPVAVIE